MTLDVPEQKTAFGVMFRNMMFWTHVPRQEDLVSGEDQWPECVLTVHAVHHFRMEILKVTTLEVNLPAPTFRVAPADLSEKQLS